MSDRLHVAVVGAGPSGIYVTQALAKADAADVDVIERLPVPFGLLRYGVAPDHHRIKSLVGPMGSVFERPGVRFLGGVEVGSVVAATDLMSRYDAVVYATGAPESRPMGITGESLEGSLTAAQLVAWYNGAPGSIATSIDARAAVVFGMGNVALDVARILTRHIDELRRTDIPDSVLEALESRTITDVYIVGRRGPLQAKFSSVELRELDALDDIEMVVRSDELVVVGEAEATPDQRRNLERFREWADRAPTGDAKRVHFRFGLQPEALRGSKAVERVELRRMTPGPDAAWSRSEHSLELTADLVVNATGFRSVAIAGVPFDVDRYLIPNQAGRVTSEAGMPHVYVAGWAKRGPSGVIGTNRADAQETVSTLLADLAGLTPPSDRDPDSILRLLADRGVSPVSWADWLRIDKHERLRGLARGSERVKIYSMRELIELATASRNGEAAPHERQYSG